MGIKRKKNLSLIEQDVSIRTRFPQFKATSHMNKIIWIGNLKPQPMSCFYTVRIEYSLTNNPKVTIITPKLKRYNNQPIPHMYRQKGLCLYYPNAKEWKRCMWISQTIIPWISLWLHYYEYWLVTGEWMGGGIEHY